MEVSFERSEYSVNEGHGVEVMVKLDHAPDHPMDIRLQKTNMNGDGDYSGIPSILTFERGETEKRFTFFAEPDDESDDGETVMVNFGALPAMVQKGDPSEATMKLRDNGGPSEDGITCIDNNRANIVTVLSARGEISSPARSTPGSYRWTSLGPSSWRSWEPTPTWISGARASAAGKRGSARLTALRYLVWSRITQGSAHRRSAPETDTSCSQGSPGVPSQRSVLEWPGPPRSAPGPRSW